MKNPIEIFESGVLKIGLGLARGMARVWAWAAPGRGRSRAWAEAWAYVLAWAGVLNFLHLSTENTCFP